MNDNSNISQENDIINYNEDTTFTEIKKGNDEDENKDKKIDLRKGFYIKKNNKNNGERKSNELIENSVIKKGSLKDEEDFDYLKSIKIKKRSRIDYEKIFKDIYEIRENYEEDKHRKYTVKKKTVRLKVINQDNINKRQKENNIYNIKKYNINTKKFFKEHFTPINNNIYKKYSITENSMAFNKFGIFRDKIKYKKKNSVLEKYFIDSKNIIKENDYLNKKNNIRENNVSKYKSSKNRTKRNISADNKIIDSDTSEKFRKNCINWYRKWIFLKLWKIKNNIIDKNKNDINKQNINENKTNDNKEIIELDKKGDNESNENEQNNINKDLIQNKSIKNSNIEEENINMNKNNKKIDEKNDILEQLSLKKENSFENKNNEEQNKDINNNNKDNNILKVSKDISKNLVLSKSSYNPKTKNRIKSNEKKLISNSKNSIKNKSKISFQETIFKKIESKSRRELTNKKINKGKKIIKKLDIKDDYLKENKIFTEINNIKDNNKSRNIKKDITINNSYTTRAKSTDKRNIKNKKVIINNNLTNISFLNERRNYNGIKNMNTLNEYSNWNKGRNEKNVRRKIDRNFLNKSAVYNSKDKINIEMKEYKSKNNIKKNFLPNEYFYNNDNKSNQRLKSSKDIYKKQKNKKGMILKIK